MHVCFGHDRQCKLGHALFSSNGQNGGPMTTEFQDRPITRSCRIDGTRRRESHAGVAELADAQDLKSWVPRGACGFDSRPRQISNNLQIVALVSSSAPLNTRRL